MGKRAYLPATSGEFDTEALQRLRLGKSLTTDELARALGVTRQAVESWEAGKTEPRLAHLKKLSDYFGLSFAYFLRPATPAAAGTEG